MSRDSNLEGISKTQYRIISNRTFFADRYLQFKSTKPELKFKLWLPFFEIVEVECWRYIPKEKMHIFHRLDEQSCPTGIYFCQESHLISCFNGQEDYDMAGVTPFTKKYPHIEDYFVEFNKKRQAYLEKEKAAEEKGITNL